MAMHIELPMTPQISASLCSGDEALLSGVIYTARDAAHKRLCEMLDDGARLPVELRGAVIYYAGPTIAPPGRVSGSIGPTTSSRMDVYTPRLLREGVSGIIGKGPRSDEVVKALVSSGAIYFAAIGGAGALLSECVTSCEIIAFPELGAEAIRRLEIENFPVIVAIDGKGRDIYKEGRLSYLKSVME